MPILLVPGLIAFAQVPATGDRPLNLSLPRELKPADLLPEGSDPRYDPLVGDARGRRRVGGQGGGLLPYGRGYDARQRQAASTEAGVGSRDAIGMGWGASGGSSGMGGGGRGGIGHGR
jgi:hypothetical protein